jgi:hypothetical protein
VKVGDEVMTPNGPGTVIRIRNEAERRHHKYERYVEVSVHGWIQWFRPDELSYE